MGETALSGGGGALGFLDPPVLVWRGEPAAEGEDAAGVGGDLVATIVRQQCLDTMADLPPFRYRAILSLPDGQAAAGCCRGTEPAALVETAWRVEHIGGVGALEGAEAAVSFETDRVTGSAGCNRFFGPLALDGRSIEIGPLASTRMMCAEPVMQQERRLLEALTGVDRYLFDGPELLLQGEGGEPLIRLAPQTAP